jgi:hypothetical protein
VSPDPDAQGGVGAAGVDGDLPPSAAADTLAVALKEQIMRTLTLVAAVAALAIAAPALADAGGAYKLDAKGKCHDAKGAFAKAEMCKAPAAAAGGKCRDVKTKKFAKCGAPNTELVPTAKK